MSNQEPLPASPRATGDGSDGGGIPATSVTHPTAPPAPAKNSAGKAVAMRLLRVVLALAVIAGGGLAWKHLSGSPEVASVGDCLNEAAADDIKTVPCDSTDAAYKVVGKIEGKTESEARSDDAICAAHPTTENIFSSGKETGNMSGDGMVLCLETLKK